MGEYDAQYTDRRLTDCGRQELNSKLSSEVRTCVTDTLRYFAVFCLLSDYIKISRHVKQRIVICS